MIRANVIRDPRIREFVEHGLSDKREITRIAYVNDLIQFDRWLEEHGIKFTDADHRVVKKYLRHLETAQKRTKYSTARVATSLRLLFRFFDRPLPKRIFTVPVNIKYEAPSRRILSHKQIADLFGAIEGDNPIERRDRAMFSLLYGIGFLNKDVLDLNFDQVSVRDKLIRPFGKTNNPGMAPRVVPLEGRVLAAMRDWLGHYGRESLVLHRGARLDKHAVFVGVNGGRITRQGMTWILQQYAAKAGIKPKITPMWLHDSFQRHLFDAGIPLADISMLTGSIAYVGKPMNTRDRVEHYRAILRENLPFYAL